MDKDTQALKVKFLELQQLFFTQEIENCTLKMEKLAPILTREKMILMEMQRGDNEKANGTTSAVPEMRSPAAPETAAMS